MERAENSDRELVRMMERRSPVKPGPLDPDEQEALWGASDRLHSLSQQVENLVGWVEYDEHLAAVFRQRANERDQQARQKRQLLKTLKRELKA